MAKRQAKNGASKQHHGIGRKTANYKIKREGISSARSAEATVWRYLALLCSIHCAAMTVMF